MINYISYFYLYEPFRTFINIITNIPTPQKYSEAKKDMIWNDAMGKEIDAFVRTETWSVGAPPRVVLKEFLRSFLRLKPLKIKQNMN